jgi:hypothetical protein
MGYNKFIKRDGTILLDLTQDNVSAENLMVGVTAHNRSGEVIEGAILEYTGNNENDIKVGKL